MMRNSDYARLIQSEAVYKEKIRQQEIAIAELRAKIKYYVGILRQDVQVIGAAEPVYTEKIRHLEKENQELRDLINPIVLADFDNGEYSEPDVIKGEVVGEGETWTMWHDPDGNEYPGPSALLVCGLCNLQGFTEAGYNYHMNYVHKVPYPD